MDKAENLSPPQPPAVNPVIVEEALVALSAEAQRVGNHKNRYFLIAAIIALSIFVAPMLKLFIVPLILAATFVTIFYPFYRIVTKMLWNNKTIGAIVCCLAIVFCALIPAYAAGYLITRQAIDLYSTAETKVVDLMKKSGEGKIGELTSSKYMHWIGKYNIDWRSSLQEGLQGAAKAATAVVNKTSASVLGLVVSLLITLFCMFYLFIDGEAFVRRLNHLVPLRQEYKDLLFSRFLQTSRATVKATLIIGIIQGVLGSLTLLFFGIKSWFLWGVIMIILSVIPMLGAGTVLIPAGIIQIIMGNPWRGIALIVISIAVISNIDSFIRPRIVGRQAKMHDLVIFFSTIGGIAVFGIMGFIIGPVIAALFMTFIDIYSTEFKDYLESEG
ncbi:MAG TPA: AI-2E family transporter [Chitinivibrionales bacterium]